MRRDDFLSIGNGNLSDALRVSGALYEAEAAVRRALVSTRALGDRHWEAIDLEWLGLTLAARKMATASSSTLQRCLRMFIGSAHNQGEGIVNSCLGQRALWLGEFSYALAFADRAWELAPFLNYEGDFIRAARMQGAATVGLRELVVADERLHHALARARQVNYVEEELSALIALAELGRQQGKPDEARELLDDAWDYAERGPHPLLHADAFNVLAQIERDADNSEKAIEAATEAYRLAWCDGPPFAYHWGLVAAQKHLQELGAPEPEMLPFDESKFEPMPEVEIDPDDEFHADKDLDN